MRRSPQTEKVAAEVSQTKPITYDQKDTLVLRFDDLIVAHKRLSRAAGTMSSLCKLIRKADAYHEKQHTANDTIKYNPRAF